jgi:hypothetical protein
MIPELKKRFAKGHQRRKQQKSTSLATRAEADYAEYCCQNGEILKLGASDAFVIR